jgi:hypothetical protein
MNGDAQAGTGLRVYSAILQAVAIASGIVLGILAFQWITG